MVDLAETVWRDFETDGVPSSGKHKVLKSKVRQWGAYLENLATLAYATSLVYDDLDDLNANLVPGANTPALVIGDGANDGIYMKVGATTTGSWSRIGDVPGRQFIKAADAGAGTANAIVATTSIPIPAADGGALIALNIFETNTASPVTVSFNGGSALTIKSSSGNDIAIGGLTEGMIVAGFVSGSTFRLLSDQASSAVLTAAEAAQAAAEAARDVAVAAALSVLTLESFGADGTTAGDTQALQDAIAWGAANGGIRISVGARTYVIDDNIEIDADDILIEGQHPQLSCLELPRARGSWLLVWAASQDTQGGGLRNITLRLHADITALEASGNAGVRFGSSNNGAGPHYHANGYVFEDVTIVGAAQYGCGHENGSDFDWRNIKVLDHGYTDQSVGTCIGAYIYPKDASNKSRNGRVHNLYAEISDAYETAVGGNLFGAAVKLQTLVDLKASQITAYGGKEAVCSIDSIDNGEIEGLRVVCKSGVQGAAIRSRFTGTHSFESTSTMIRGLKMVAGSGGVINLSLGSGASDGSYIPVENFKIFDIDAPLGDLRYTNYTRAKNLWIVGGQMKRLLASHTSSGSSAPASGGDEDWKISSLKVSQNTTIVADNSDIDIEAPSGVTVAISGTGTKSRGAASQQTISTDLNITLTPGLSPIHTLITSTHSGDRTTTLSTTGANLSTRFVITRTGGGLFQRSIGSLGAIGQGEWVEVKYDGSAYYIAQRGRVSKPSGANIANADTTLNPHAHAPVQVQNTTLTADRAVALGTTNAVAGDQFLIKRLGGGAFNLNVGSGPLKAMATNTWALFEYDGSAWVYLSGGSL